jgi:aryl-alcohol dehydrogenase-like predicted oxidoreductase
MSGGVNILDTGLIYIYLAINYRYMKSERALGKAINSLINKYNYKRDQLIICSKIGFVPEDADNGHRSHYFVSKLVEQNKMTLDDIIYDEKNRPIHCIHPEYLSSQLELSLDNLKLETLDVLYLHNVFETQGPAINKQLLETRVSNAFEYLV